MGKLIYGPDNILPEKAPQSLADLAAAFQDGDDSAFDPLIDHLLEMGRVDYCKRLWYMFKRGRSAGGRSAVLDTLRRGEMLNKVFDIFDDKSTNERFGT